MTDPLDGILVADLARNVAGPFCTQILADMGAEVIKIEPPGRGDDARAWAPPFWGEESSAFMSMNRNKRSLAVDIKTPAGQEVLRRLLSRADVLVQSFRTGVMDSLGFGYEQVRLLNPSVVYCSVTAYGLSGPLKDLPGYDALMQAYGGLMSVNGHPGQPPARVGTSIVDMGTGMWAALGILGALRNRDQTGQGAHVVTALFDSALMWVSYHMMGYFASGEVPEPQGSRTAMIVPYEAFPTSDGYLMIAAASDALFSRACQALGIAEAAHDPRFSDNPSRVRNQKALFDLIAGVTRRETAQALQERLRAAGVPCAAILTLDRVAVEPQTEASGMFLTAAHPRISDYRSVGLPIRWDGQRPGIRQVPPLLGEHTSEVLRELAYSASEIDRLERDEVIQR
ncbi:MAG: CaiB/BaiF CoA transferase family protein [Candidatus Methylomirabilia bacterium]